MAALLVKMFLYDLRKSVVKQEKNMWRWSTTTTKLRNLIWDNPALTCEGGRATKLAYITKNTFCYQLT